MLSKFAAITATASLALTLALDLTTAERLCSIAPDKYAGAKKDYPEVAFALDTLEDYAIATWFTDRLPESDRAARLTSLLSECTEDTRLSVVVYGLPNKDCDAGLSSHGEVQSTSDYEAFLAQLTDAMGDRKVLYVVEPDAVGLLTQEGGCGEAAGYLDNLKVAIKALSANENAELYVDVGYWLLAYERTTADVASVLTELATAGRIKGITINTSNFRSTDECVEYCSNFQAAMGYLDMSCVIDTSRNYHGSPSDEWCNVKQAGIGKPPTSTTGISNLDHFLWIKPPGESDGECAGASGVSESYPSDSLVGTKAGTFFREGFELLWDQGYFVTELGMPTIADGISVTTSTTGAAVGAATSRRSRLKVRIRPIAWPRKARSRMPTRRATITTRRLRHRTKVQSRTTARSSPPRSRRLIHRARATR